MEMNFLSDEGSYFPVNYSWNCGGKLFTFEQPRVMGIVNCTPDSFYEKNRSSDFSTLQKLVEKHAHEGAEIIDIGGYSSRPGAEEVSPEEEWNRIARVIQFIKKEFPEVLVSVDTFRAEIAHKACNEGANVINDISAGKLDEELFREVAYHKVPLILMHMRGNPQTMQNETQYENLLAETLYYFSERIGKAREAGIIDLAVDPGFGFSKTLEQNYFLFRNLKHFHLFDVPLLVGISRKSMIYNLLETTADETLNATTALHALALAQGANILRVHDVKEAKETVKLIEAMRRF